MADFDWVTRVPRVTWVLIEHPRSLAHVTLLAIDKQGESSRPLPKAIAVWRGFTRVTMSLPVTANREHRPPMHKKLITHYKTQSFNYGLKSPHSVNYNLRLRRWTSQFTHWTTDYFILFIYISGLSAWSQSSLFSWITLMVLRVQRKPDTMLELRE